MNNTLTPIIESLRNDNFLQTIQLAEALIQQDETNPLGYWYLGLALLLQGQEEEAQSTWFMVLFNGDEQQVKEWTGQLTAILLAEAEYRQQQTQELNLARIVRYHLATIAEDHVPNLIQLLGLSVKLGCCDEELFHNLALAEKLEAYQDYDQATLLEVFHQFVTTLYVEPWVPAATKSLLPFVVPIHKLKTTLALMQAATDAAYTAHYFDRAIEYGELCLSIDPTQPDVLSHICAFHLEINQFDTADRYAHQLYEAHGNNLIEVIHSYFLLAKSRLGSGGRWEEAMALIAEYKEYLNQLIQLNPTGLNRRDLSKLSNAAFFLPYIADDAPGNRAIHNNLMAIYQRNVALMMPESLKTLITKNRESKVTSSHQGPLKVGFMSHCFRSHSVGWLTRHFFEHFDRDRFTTYGYFVGYRDGVPDYLQSWFEEQFTHSRRVPRDGIGIATAIAEDNIDILVDLDSITADITMEALAMKPAPVQVSWLGWDACGLPTIDYYLADPYCLPPQADDYYQEKICRLPHCLMAVEGFDVGVRSITRRSLGIPQDAIVYFCSQTGIKRNPDNVRAQMKILHGVPNSYFLIKGIKTDVEAMTSFFHRMATEEGVDPDRLIFLHQVPRSTTHIANIAIADIVLDTYPYNGATTTAETLWMERPLVTQVGQQFSSRNTYSLMVNAYQETCSSHSAIDDNSPATSQQGEKLVNIPGVASTVEEYVEWGIKLGLDENLRQQLSWQLRKGKQTAPLWNPQQFAIDFGQALINIWQDYQNHQ